MVVPTLLIHNHIMPAAAAAADDIDDVVETPVEFLCPITGQLMIDPLMCRTGFNFERNAILEWLQKHSQTCPMTRKAIRASDLVPNCALQLRIRRWCEEQQVELPPVPVVDDGAVLYDVPDLLLPMFLCTIYGNNNKEEDEEESNNRIQPPSSSSLPEQSPRHARSHRSHRRRRHHRRTLYQHVQLIWRPSTDS